MLNTSTLLGTNISPEKSILKMIFLFPRWDMLISWRVITFFQIDWVEWNDQLRQTIFVVFQHSSGFQLQAAAQKRTGNDSLQHPEIHVTYSTYVPYLFHRQICLDHTPFQGLSKYPLVVLVFRDEHHVSVEAMPRGHSPNHFDWFFQRPGRFKRFDISIRNTFKGPSNHTQSMYTYIIISI